MLFDRRTATTWDHITNGTPQELFDVVVRGLAGQGWEQSTDSTGTLCLYRSSNGLCCAAGHLIPDVLYKQEYEGRSFSYVVMDHDLCSLASPEALSLVREMQGTHDMDCTPQYRRQSFRDLADRHGLTWPQDVP